MCYKRTFNIQLKNGCLQTNNKSLNNHLDTFQIINICKFNTITSKNKIINQN